MPPSLKKKNNAPSVLGVAFLRQLLWMSPAAMDVRHDQKPRTSNRLPLHCSYCDQNHHTRDTCYKLNGYPPGHCLHKSHTRDGSQNCCGNRSKRDGGSSSSINLVSDGPSLHDLVSGVVFLMVCLARPFWYTTPADLFRCAWQLCWTIYFCSTSQCRW